MDQERMNRLSDFERRLREFLDDERGAAAPRPSRPPRQFNSPQLYDLDEVFIGNLPYQCTEEDLRALCLPSGQVLSCTFHRKPNRQPKGSAFVRFADVDGAEHLFQRGNIGQGLTMLGRRLTIDGRKLRNAKLVGKDNQVNLRRVEVGYWAQRDVFVPCWRCTECRAQFDFGHHRIVLRFKDEELEELGLCGGEITIDYTATLRFKSIREVARDEHDGIISAFYVDLKSPPRVEQNLSDDMFGTTRPSERCTELPPAVDGNTLGTCLVWRLEVEGEDLRPASSVVERLSHHQFYDSEEYRDIERRDTQQRNWLQEERLKLLAAEIDDRLCYALECLMSAGYVREENITNELFDELRKGDVDVCERALYRLWGAERRIYDPTKALRKAVARVKRMRAQRDLPAHCLQTRNALVTPTRVLFFPPVPEQSNRVLRYWEQNKQLGRYFLRVSFVEEEFGQLFLLNGQAGKRVQTRIDKILMAGIVSPLSGRHYEFMAYSSSQLREGSCWFFSSDNPTRVTVNDIVSWMGDFSGNKVVAKYAARIGQCFSSSKIGVTHVPLEQMSRIPDVVRNGYTFSDGVGRISHPLAVKIQDALKLKSLPSAFQIRFAGDKGVVTVDPEASPGEAQQENLWWRDSMRKFKSDHYVLEVLSYSKYLPGHLNHQIIAVMSTHGVSDEAFLSLQTEQVAALDSMVVSEARAKAVLSQQGSPIYSRLHQLMIAGLTVDEPFVHNCLHVLRQRQLVDLKTKARIAVPQARTLIGVMDEAAVLEYGQVFLQYTGPPSAKPVEQPRVHQGWVVVAKCPVLHPGDVRMLMAVDRPELHHVVDCLVFPQKGERPHPNELAGSDLDGDLYFVSWDASLFLPGNINYPAMDYSGPAVETVDSITQRDIIQFFSKFIQNNFVGVIANAHKVHADSSPAGVKDPACIRLAALHSMAVDFNKTGVPAEMPTELRVRNFPDFMGKKHDASYVSDKVLGELYRRVHLEKSLLLIDSMERVELNKALLVPGYERFVEEAQETKQHYDLELTEIMNQHSVQTEAEAVTGNVMKMRGMFKKGKRWFNLQQQLQPLTEHLWAKYRRVFDEQFAAATADTDDGQEATPPPDADDDTARRRQQKAAAWYYVTYAPQHEDENEDDGGGARRGGRRRRRRNRNKKRQPLLLSFAWIMHDVMGSIIKLAGQSTPGNDGSPQA